MTEMQIYYSMTNHLETPDCACSFSQLSDNSNIVSFNTLNEHIKKFDERYRTRLQIVIDHNTDAKGDYDSVAAYEEFDRFIMSMFKEMGFVKTAELYDKCISQKHDSRKKPTI